jgi:phospholipid-binding lipoprotein MlaA
VKAHTLFLLSGLLLLEGGCAAVPTDPVARAEYRKTNDPLEPLNRKIFSFNLYIDRKLIKPIAQEYVRLLPQPARDSIRNFVSNLGEPLVFGNNVLQGHLGRARTTAFRFALNSTLGIAGLNDFASAHRLRKQTGDFGQTFYTWGVGDGPYLILPLLGPTNSRDAVGQGAQAYLDPYRYVVENNRVPNVVAYSPAILGNIDKRARAIDTLNEIQREAIDYYASLRSLYTQDRAAQLRGDSLSPPPGADEGLYEDPGSPAPDKNRPSGGPPDH